MRVFITGKKDKVGHKLPRSALNQAPAVHVFTRTCDSLLTLHLETAASNKASIIPMQTATTNTLSDIFKFY